MARRIFVAGHQGMVGSALLRQIDLDRDAEVVARSKDDLDLTNQAEVSSFFQREHIDEVYLAAAKVGGIHANDRYPAEFIYENLMIECNVVESAYRSGVEKLLLLGSSCIYPRDAEQPMREDSLLTGPLEPTNEPYAVAKIAGIKLCESYNRQYGTDYRSVMPTNLYGPGDNFHPENSHVVPGLIRRIHEARRAAIEHVVVWGSGTPLRELLHVDDMASACLHIMQMKPDDFKSVTSTRLSHINIGSGEEHSIADLARTIAKVVGYSGKLDFDLSKPDGAPRKLMDSSLIQSTGWSPTIGIEDGILDTYQWYLSSAVH